jgi:hypothetical protein
MSHPHDRPTRRAFLLGGGAAGLAAAGYAVLRSAGPSDSLQAGADLAMPGPYPGEVVEVRHRDAVAADHTVDGEVVARMLDRGVGELTGADAGDVAGSWGRFFARGDVVGVKVNPVGRAPLKGEAGRVAGAVGAVSSFAVVAHVVRRLGDLGIPPRDVVLFERYAEELTDAGYDRLADGLGTRWLASAVRYTGTQLDVEGFDQGRGACSPELARHVAGYDPDVFVSMGFCAPEHDKKDDRRFRSHLSLIVTRLVNKVITIPVLKDHRSAGVTLALKNMSHGMNNNVARSHLSGLAHGRLGDGPEQVTGPNQCNTFIPHAASQRALREKATLHILDGLIGVYEGGPGSWNRSWRTWRHNGLLFATDPVALDRVGWDLIDAKRRQMGWPPVGRMGLVSHAELHALAGGVAGAPLAAAGPLEAAALTAGAWEGRDKAAGGWASEVFNVRQPDHVALAGQLGLGRFAWEEIRYRRVALDGQSGGRPAQADPAAE